MEVVGNSLILAWVTVNTTTSAVAYTGNGTTATYPYTFQIADSSDLVVYTLSADGLTLTALMDTVGYTVTGAGVATGGNVILSAGNLGNGVYLFIATDPIEVQRLLLQQGAAFNPADLMNAFDLLTREVQATRRVANNGIQIPVAESLLGLNTVLPPKLARANSFVTFDANGLLSLLSTSAIGSVLVAGNYIVDRPVFTAGVTTALLLTQAPGTVNNAWVYFDGVYQQRNTYTVSGTTLTLGAAVPVGVASVEVVQAGVLPINTPADNSVGASAIQNGVVTGLKVASNTLAGSNMLAGTVTDREVAADLLPAPWRNFIIDGSAVLGSASDYVASVSGTYGYGKAEMWKGALFGSTVAGTLTRSVTSTLGRTGRTVKWSAVTTTGSGIAKFRTYIEAIDAADLKNQNTTCAVQVLHDVGSAISVAVNVYKADAVDNFGSVTAIRSGTPVLVASATNTTISELAIAMGDCSNGILIEVVFTVGAVTSKNFEITEATLNLSAGVTTFAYEPIATILERGQRYFIRYAQGSGGVFVLGIGMSINAGYMEILVSFPVVMRIAPSLAVSSAAHFQTTEWVSGAPTARTPTSIVLGGSGSANPRVASVIAQNAAAYTIGSLANLHTAGPSATLDFDARF